MNEKKFCFVICTNNEVYLKECVHYINHLVIPDGYEIDLLTITDAPCITQGYNEGMLASDAKYKIYMHQDVFLLNRYLLFDLLSIFQADSQIGMIGMVGYEKVAADGIMWNEPQHGNLYNKKNAGTVPTAYRYSLEDDGFKYVSIIDGLFMATSYDLPWDTKVLTGWDFYDAFQSMNFLLHGYKIAVPNQVFPWCLHDDKLVLNMFNYHQYHMLFVEKYKSYLGKSYLDILKHHNI